MRNPNGFGTVVRLSGVRRRPYAARVTVPGGGKQKQKNISYHTTQADALAALSEFYQRPYDLSARNTTMAELFGMWMKRPKALAEGTVAGLVSTYGYCARLHNTPYAAIRAHMIQACIDDCPRSSQKGRIKELFGHLDRLAYELDIINKKYSDVIKVADAPRQKDIIVFTDDEVARLWDSVGAPWVDTVLILLYSGWRVSELLGLRKGDIDMEAGTMTGGSKTKAGRGRVVPIHSRIRSFVDSLMAAPGEYLIGHKGGRMTYSEYQARYKKALAALGMKHTIHETRHTFRTWLDAAGANIVCVNKIMGHKSGDMGLDTYVQKAVAELKKTIELIK